MFLEKNDVCPTCDQTIENKDKLILDTKNEAYQVQSTLTMVESNGSVIDSKISNLEEIINLQNNYSLNSVAEFWIRD